MQIYNTLTRKKEVFEPAGSQIGFYYCGPTVYWTQHIGNLRGSTMADFSVRSLRLLFPDHRVVYVRNYTDVGHLAGDNEGNADTGEDRMEKGARREGTTPEEIAQKYIAQYEKDSTLLNILPPDVAPRATEHIPHMINMISVLLDEGYAYTTPLAVYFDVSKAKDYTRLSGQDIEKLKSAAGRGEAHDPDKRSPNDFALWFFKAGEHSEALQTWASPFRSPLVEDGRGLPGWHIECSAMSKQYLGDTFDIHMGGIEHIPVHHTNEIAQSEAANGAPLARFWMHNEHLLVEGKKMAKSEGTGFTLSEIMEKGFDPLALRYFFAQAHYRSQQNFTWEALEAAQNGLNKLYQKFTELGEDTGTPDGKFVKTFIDKLSNDFNVPQALTLVSEVLNSSLSDADKRATILAFDTVLGFDFAFRSSIAIPPEIAALAQKREEARAAKDWERADALREQIEEAGFSIKDGPSGPIIS